MVFHREHTELAEFISRFFIVVKLRKGIFLIAHWLVLHSVICRALSKKTSSQSEICPLKSSIR